MKDSNIFLYGIVLLGTLASAYGHHMLSEEDKACLEKKGFPLAAIGEPPHHRAPEEIKHFFDCMTSCRLEISGSIEDNKINGVTAYQKLLERKPDIAEKITAEQMQECADAAGEVDSECETAGKFADCLRKYNLFHGPHPHGPPPPASP